MDKYIVIASWIPPCGSSENGALALRAGDMVLVSDPDESMEMWMGVVRGNAGTFPRSCVRPLYPASSPRDQMGGLDAEDGHPPSGQSFVVMERIPEELDSSCSEEETDPSSILQCASCTARVHLGDDPSSMRDERFCGDCGARLSGCEEDSSMVVGPHAPLVKANDAGAIHHALRGNVEAVVRDFQARFQRVKVEYVNALLVALKSESSSLGPSQMLRIMDGESKRLDRVLPFSNDVLDHIDLSFSAPITSVDVSVRRSEAREKWSLPSLRQRLPSDRGDVGGGDSDGDGGGGEMVVSSHTPGEAARLIQAAVRGWIVRRRTGRVLHHIKRRRQCALEIVESERKYVRNLQLFVEQFRAPLLQSSVLSDQEASVLFSNVEAILGVNKALLEGLEAKLEVGGRWAPKQTLGDVFLQLVPFMRLYTQYVNNFDLATAEYARLSHRSEFKEIIVACRKHPQVGALAFDAFQIQPVQRVPRYILLVSELLRYTEEGHADFPLLQKALGMLKEVGQRINEEKRRSENRRVILDIQQRLEGVAKELVQPHREFVRQGDVLRAPQGSSAPRARHGISSYLRGAGEHMMQPVRLFLFNDVLLITEKKNVGTVLHDRVVYVFLEQLSIDALSAEAQGDVLHLNSPYGSVETFACPTATDCMRWMSAFNAASRGVLKRRQSLRVMEETDLKSIRARLHAAKSSPSTSLDAHEDSLGGEPPSLPCDAHEPRGVERASLPHGAPSVATTAISAHTRELERENTSLRELIVQCEEECKALERRAHSAEAQVESVTASAHQAQLRHKSQCDLAVSEAIARVRPPKVPTIGRVIELLGEGLKLQHELFAPAIGLQTIVPEYCQRLHPDHLRKLSGRLHMLRAALKELNELDDRVGLLLCACVKAKRLEALIRADGSACIGEMKTWIQASFPRENANPRFQRPRKLMASILKWYLELTSAWDQVMRDGASLATTTREELHEEAGT